MNRIKRIINILGKQNVILIMFIFVILGITGLYQTFSFFISSEGETVVDGVKTYKFILNADNNTNTITIAANSSKKVAITVTNQDEIELLYGIYYSSSNDLSNVNIGYLPNNEYQPKGTIKPNSKRVVRFAVDNVSSSNINITFGIKYGLTTGGDLTLETGQNWLYEYSKYINAPNLDNGNLIPVYYDETAEVWKKADSTNLGSNWYDYEAKRWANAVLISDSTKKSTYQNATVGTTITDSDITAFYVWIPRYKYRVWNITRQGGDESTYAYQAYTYGIDIEFETGTASSGNVECNYNINSEESYDNLSDTCVYNKTDTITTESGNTNYKDAWYTHPAFTFGGEEKTGFWIGKFETTGTAESPTVLPDSTSLREQTVDEQFTTSKIFQNYLSNNIDAHMLTNLEWGAVAYLSHSIYGLCDGENSCRDVYINNSEGYYTGRSAGVLALDSTYSTDGTYDYKGYLVGDSTKDISKVASTTGNITGVYDISGGAYEYVMGNMVDDNGAFYPSYAGNSWNGSSTLDSKYYNSYSYGEWEETQSAFNRARLGDATAEVDGSDDESYSDAWQPGSGITSAYSCFVSYDYSWFVRGGDYSDTSAGPFYFDYYDGNAISDLSFRSSLS